MPRSDDPTATDASPASGADQPVDIALDATTPSPEPAASSPGGRALAPGTTIGRYQLGAVIGTGGMGVVYRARDPELGRDVAIKVVAAQGSRTQQRLLAEARAMAKLSHPAVMPVFDVGDVADGVYIVMPLITGGTLHDWIHAAKRPWRQVVDRFVAAGRGLAAAHAAGLIHRDFKPRNVMLDGDNLLVADFGIAAQIEPSVAMGGEASASQPSTISGTPAYMAPEQARGDDIDARADQYSFCVSLWEGLHGERPQQAETRTSGVLASGGVPEVPSDRRGTPGWLLAAVARGFASAPDHRWQSMAVLLSHLQQRASRARRVVLVGATLTVVVAAAAAAVTVTGRADKACPEPRAQLATSWSADIRTRIEHAFTETRLPYATETLERIVPVLDSYASEWRTLQIATCRAQRTDRADAAQLHDRRMLCLDRRLAALRARTTAFATADPQIVRRAASLVDDLPSLEDCSNVAALGALFPLPAAPEQRARIAAAETRLDKLDVLFARGAWPERMALATELLATTRALGHPPTLARALEEMASAESYVSRPTEATLRELVLVAAQTRDDRRLVIAWSDLIDELVGKGRSKEAVALEPNLEAALARAGSPKALVFRVQTSLGTRAARDDDFETAAARFKVAVESSVTGRNRVQSLHNLAALYYSQGRATEALPFAEDALAASETAAPPTHPSIANELQLVAQISRQLGDPKRAYDLLERALAIRTATFGADHVDVATMLVSLGNVARLRGAFDDAERRLRRAVEIFEKEDRPRDLAPALTGLAEAVAAQGKFDVARPIYVRALEVLERTVGKDHHLYAISELNYAKHLANRELCDEAHPYLDHCLAYLERVGHPGSAGCRAALARCYLADGKPGDAIRTLESAIATCRKGDCGPGTLDGMLAQLADALVTAGRDRQRAVGLMKEARAGYVRAGSKSSIDKADDWLRAHGR